MGIGSSIGAWNAFIDVNDDFNGTSSVTVWQNTFGCTGLPHPFKRAEATGKRLVLAMNSNDSRPQLPCSIFRHSHLQLLTILGTHG
jgi:hypothetical protein